MQNGDRIGILTVVGFAGRDKKSNKLWLVKCDCGSEPYARTQSQLSQGLTKSCGCLRRARGRAMLTGNSNGWIHGHASGGKVSIEYASWMSMIARCENKKHSQFKDYGGRGITVCGEWRYSFETFLADMGMRPEKHTLDRIDNDKGYSKDNCRWSDRRTQTLNSRTPVFVEYKGNRLCLKDAEAMAGLRRGFIGDYAKRHIVTHQEALDRGTRTPNARAIRRASD